MNRRNLIVGGVVAVLVVLGAWVFLGSGGGNPVQAGVGPYNQEMIDCQERVLENQMHLADLEFMPDTTWRQAGDELKLGGKLTRPGPRGSKTAYTYECILRGGRVIAAMIQ